MQISSIQKRPQQKACNCRNSKCTKLYCQCFAGGLICNKNCRCIDCHNHGSINSIKHNKEYPNNLERRGKDMRLKGCACRKTGCTKKYCECFQGGLRCSQLCKCIQCQNNESLTNRIIINELKRYNSDTTSKPKVLYPIVLSQNSDHLKSIITESNPLNLDQEFLTKSIHTMIQGGNQSSQVGILESFIKILNEMQKNLSESNQMRDEEQEVKSQ